jgi:threonine/homoserine/homoserine lactone efflux protein
MPDGSAPLAIRWGAVGPLLLTALAIMGSPGPATMSLVAAGSVHGVRRCVPYLVGVVVGTTVVLVAVASGITAVLLAVPAVHPVLTGVSSAYILWLAYHIATAPVLDQQADGADAPDAPSPAGGALLGVANPKAWIAIAAVFASVRLAEPGTADATAKIAMLTGMIILINTGWLVAGRSLAPLLRDPRRARLVNVTLAVALIGATVLAMLR